VARLVQIGAVHTALSESLPIAQFVGTQMFARPKVAGFPHPIHHPLRGLLRRCFGGDGGTAASAKGLSGGSMGTSSVSNKSAIGFLTILDDPQHGLFGGYLLLNLAGRPLEFHCTAPIKPNRAQQILYGPTLDSFLYGEQIGGALLAEAKIAPLAVCTDREPALAVRSQVSLPVALVLPDEQASEPPAATTRDDGWLFSQRPGESKTLRLDTAHPAGPRLVTFSLGRNRLAVSARSEEDRRQILERLAELDESFDLNEPFMRIRQAIEEAQQAVR
jgi:hypothetical protein